MKNKDIGLGGASVVELLGFWGPKAFGMSLICMVLMGMVGCGWCALNLVGL